MCFELKNSLSGTNHRMQSNDIYVRVTIGYMIYFIDHYVKICNIVIIMNVLRFSSGAEVKN